MVTEARRRPKLIISYFRYHGGWLAPNIYYLGHAGSVIVNGIRISGASGIYKSHDFHKGMGCSNYALDFTVLIQRAPNTGHFERVPYDRSTVRSAYHTRKYDIHRLSHLTPRATSDENNDQVDIFLSHDWPIGVTRFGDEKTLLRKKQFFTEEVSFGSVHLVARVAHRLNGCVSRSIGPYKHPRFPALVAASSAAPSDILVLRSSPRQVCRCHPSRQA
jgi:hypothetical protein